MLCRTWRYGKIKRYFTKIMSLPLNQVGEEEGNFTCDINNYKGVNKCDELLEEEILRCSKVS